MDVNGVAVSSDRLFFGNDNNQFFCFDKKGQKIWEFVTNSDIENVPALVDFNVDRYVDVVFGTEAGVIYVLDGLSGQVI